MCGLNSMSSCSLLLDGPFREISGPCNASVTVKPVSGWLDALLHLSRSVAEMTVVLDLNRPAESSSCKCIASKPL